MNTNAQPGADAIAALLEEPSARPWWKRGSLWAGLAALVVLALAFAWWQSGRRAAAAPSYVTEPVQRARLEVTVSADGTLQPTRSVNVGSELSGTVTRVLVDVNDEVKKGQVLVELDTAKLRDQIARSRAALSTAQAAVAQASATLTESQAGLARLEEVQKLSGGKVPAQTEIDAARAALDRARAAEASARAGVTSAQAQLSTDETNLSKASIRSPIDGVVLTRSVDPGNAVAASLQAVTLFTLAEDLRKLELDVNVDETDVGLVAVGQKATFTVGAYLNRRYPATVTRVAYGSTKTDNVVTYTTELAVDNQDLTLRPGMTATATIQTSERAPALLVPNTALRFTPAGVAAAGAPAAASGGGGIVSKLMPRPPGGVARRSVAGNGGATGGSRQLWVLRDGAPVSLRVTVGATDGKRTEVSGGGLAEGDAVIVDQRSGAPK
ncbi:efflux RND transporter periplasmic adaptor subunit [Piscinibacter sp.]|uniref:efflux RND transporter periplasmic adaptor subunit n=1 Tax=Piscinibacter sp. TaxID=1903157 RepID=UPI0039E290CA